MLAPYPTDRLHNQHPPPPASRQSRQSNKPEIGGSILDADDAPQGVNLHAETQVSGGELAGVRGRAARPRQPDGVGDARGDRGVASGEDRPSGAVSSLFGPRHRDRRDAAAGICPAMAADRGAVAFGDDVAAVPAGPVTVVIDSTGLKVFGAGEWQMAKHGGRDRRTWRKLHLAIDPDTGEVLASALTTTEEGDVSLVRPLLDQIAAPIAAVLADGAYDGDPVYRAVADRAPAATVIIPPRATAVVSEVSAAGTPTP